MQSSRGTPNSEHDRHDRVLVARLAAGDVYQSEAGQAQRLVDGCDKCAALAADIKLIAARTSELPAARRPRDFRISPEQADRLRDSWLERFMRGFSTRGWTVVRPLAGAALAIGFALVIVGSLPLASLSSGTAPDQNPGTSTQAAAAGGPSQLSGAPEIASPTERSADKPNPSPPAPQGPPASAATPEFGGTGATTVPGVDVNNRSSSPADVAAQASAQAPTTVTAPPPPPQPQPPSKALESAAPPQSTPAYAAVAPAAAPTPPLIGDAVVPSPTQGSLDRSAFVIIGLLVAFGALIVLGIVWVARRRYSDPLVR